MIKFHHFEFELAVREDTKIHDRPIEETDLKQVEHLDCSNFDFSHEDLETMEKCTALRDLAINIGMIDLSFLSSFPMLEDLYLVYWGQSVNFCACIFRPVKSTCTEKQVHRLGEIGPPSRRTGPLLSVSPYNGSSTYSVTTAKEDTKDGKLPRDPAIEQRSKEHAAKHCPC